MRTIKSKQLVFDIDDTECDVCVRYVLIVETYGADQDGLRSEKRVNVEILDYKVEFVDDEDDIIEVPEKTPELSDIVRDKLFDELFNGEV